MHITTPVPLEWWRNWVGGILAIGTAGTFVELLLLGHYDDAWQWAPMAINVAFLVSLLWYVVSKSPTSISTVRGISILACLSSAVGLFFHFRANVEWELETTPDMHGLELFREIITGALPLLAPGAMLQLGLLGLLWAFRHPDLHASVIDAPTLPEN